MARPKDTHARYHPAKRGRASGAAEKALRGARAAPGPVGAPAPLPRRAAPPPAAAPAAGDARWTPSPAACPWAALAPPCLAAWAEAGPAGALFGAGPCLAPSSAACSGLREAPSAEALRSGPRGPGAALLGSGSAGDAWCIMGGSTSEMSERNLVWCACRSSSLCAVHHDAIMHPCIVAAGSTCTAQMLDTTARPGGRAMHRA